MKRIAILHYASPPVVGGVESTIAYQARELAGCGYSVRVISGTGALFSHNIEVIIDSRFSSSYPALLEIKSELDQGIVSEAFHSFTAQLHRSLSAMLTGYDICIAHNIPTMNKHLPLTAALAQIIQNTSLPLIAWCHDLAWTNPQYQPELHEGYPWQLLCEPWTNTQYITVSEPRQHELAQLLGVSADTIQVIVPGVDLVQYFQWTNTTRMLVSQLQLLNADGLLLLPARITRRKNIELALRVLADIRQQSGLDFRLIVTGPPGPHNPSNPGYLGELLTLRHKLTLDDVAHFLYAYSASESTLIPDDTTMANLYQLADALLFPSTQEGFGIPMLEAGIAGIPVFCADIAPLRATGLEDVTYFDPLTDTPASIATRMLRVLNNTPTYRLKLRIRKNYRWDVLIKKYLVPLIEG